MGVQIIMYPDDTMPIYIVISCNDTVIGKMIRKRGELKFWNRYKGDCYGHASLSLDSNLNHMMSFARKKLNNPFVSGLIIENIHSGIFAKSGMKSKITVFEIPVSRKQFKTIRNLMMDYWKKRQNLKYDFAGLFFMLLTGKGIKRKNRYICSHWVAEVLEKSNIYNFSEKKPKDIRPLDYYDIFRKNIIYEGLTINYNYSNENYNQR